MRLARLSWRLSPTLDAGEAAREAVQLESRTAATVAAHAQLELLFVAPESDTHSEPARTPLLLLRLRLRLRRRLLRRLWWRRGAVQMHLQVDLRHL